MRIGAITICLWCCGCGCYKEITQRPEVQASGLIGRCFVSKKELVLQNRPSLKIDELRLPQYSYAPGVVGKLPPGTHVKIVRVDQHCELMAFMIFPVYWGHNTTLVRIEDGPFAGRRVGVDQAGISIEPTHVAKEHWTPCDPNATLPASVFH